MSDWSAEPYTAGKPNPVELLEGLSPPGQVTYAMHVLAATVESWVALVDVLSSDAEEVPTWLQAVPGQLGGHVDDLIEFIEVLKAKMGDPSAEPTADGG